jgi:FtsH-binding integral membrane protein
LNPVSAIAAVNLLGWTLFFGLSSLFIYPVFGNSSLEKVLKYSFLANGIFCIIGAIGYILNIPVLQLLFFNGMGIAVIIIGITSSLLFGKLEKSSR